MLSFLRTISNTFWPICSIALFCSLYPASQGDAQVLQTFLGGEGDHGLAVDAALYGPSYGFVDPSGNLYISDFFNANIRRVDAATKLISTVAGFTLSGNANYSGDGGPATSAFLSQPCAIGEDGAGNIYIADQYNQRIRKVDAITGVITTVAGNGIQGYSGDGGLAINAQLNYPTGIAVTSAGSFYIGDMKNQVVRLVDTNGIITTFAGTFGTPGYAGDGGPATSAQLHFPTSVALDSLTGGVYILDQYVNEGAAAGALLVREVGTNGIITTVAGSYTAGGSYSGDGGPATSAGIIGAQDISVDGAGNLYIADGNGFRIRKVTKATGIISTVAGNGNFGYTGDGGPATNAQIGYRFPYNGNDAALGVASDRNGNLFIFDSGNYVVRRVDASTGIITTYAGDATDAYVGDGVPAIDASIGSLAVLSYSFDDALPFLIFDTVGNAYFTDSWFNRVRKVDSTTGIVKTIAGNGCGTSLYGSTNPPYSGEGGPAVDACIVNPSGVAVDVAGNVYFAGSAMNRVFKIDATTHKLTTIAGNGTAGSTGDNGPAASALLNTPVDLALDAKNNLFIDDSGNNKIRKIALSTGTITTFAGTGTNGFSGDGGAATNATLSSPQSVRVDVHGNVYISDFQNDRVRVVSALTGIITTIAGGGAYGNGSGDGGPASSAFVRPYGIAVDSSGNLYIADLDFSEVRRVDATTGIIESAAGGSYYRGGGCNNGQAATTTPIPGPSAVAFDSKGTLYFVAAEGAGGLICEVLPDEIFKNGFE